MTSTRNPYPFPTLQNDFDFCGPQKSVKEPYTVPTHLAQKEGPWHRLNSTGTLSSTRREIYHHDPNAPDDSLDFVLTAEYNHHREFLKDKTETLVQPETLGKEHGRILKNKTYQVPPPKPELNHPLRIAETKKKVSPHSIKNAIEGHHTQTTNRGYARKHDGGFYTS